MRYILACIYLTLAGTLATHAEPTAEREWTSTAGSTITAVATSIKDSSAHFKISGGREIIVPLGKLVEEDRTFITEHFANAPLEDSGVAVATDLAFPEGEVSGPITTGDSNYFVYVPTSLRKDRKAPLLFFTGATGGKAKSCRQFIEGAEIAGWIIAASVESENGNDFPEGNFAHVEACYDDLMNKLPIDKKRVYFAGDSGGGVMALLNCDRLKGAGAMPNIAYLLKGSRLLRQAHYYVMGGAWDFNRYLSAQIRAEAGENGFHRFNKNGHGGASVVQSNDAILWLNARYLEAQESGDFAAEKMDYNRSLLDWLRKIKDKQPHRAYYWANFDREAAPAFANLADELGKDPVSVKYAEGLDALDSFSRDILATEGEDQGSLKKHTSEKVNREADKLIGTYAGVPEIEDIAKALKNPTATLQTKKR